MTTTGASSGTTSLVDAAELAFRAYLDGDRGRMSELVDLLTPVLWQVARSQGVSRATAEDVVQLAWVRLVRGATTINDPRAVLAWLMTTVRREARRTGAKERREDADLEKAPEPPSDELPPDDLVVLEEQQALLWDHVKTLDERCQALLRVVAFAQRPDYAAISDALGMPVGSIGPTRGRCLEKLRRRLEADRRWKGHGHG